MQSPDDLQIDMLKKWNETYNSSMHKYTLNLPKDLFNKAQVKARQAGIYRVSIYFRAIIEREVNGEEKLTMENLLEAKNLSKRYVEIDRRKEFMKDFTTSPRKEIGWVKLNLRRAWKVFQPKQQIFNFRK